MKKLRLPQELSWAGILGGAFVWYLAHELGFFFSDFNCRHRWVIRVVHLLALAGSVYCGVLSYRAWKSSHHPPTDEKRAFLSLIGTLAALIFTTVVLWQTVATFLYSGCER
jgi:hypothetical protein